MNFSENTKKAGAALAGSLIGYWVAKRMGKKDNYPYILVYGFIGNLIAEEFIIENRKSIRKT